MNIDEVKADTYQKAIDKEFLKGKMDSEEYDKLSYMRKARLLSRTAMTKLESQMKSADPNQKKEIKNAR